MNQERHVLVIFPHPDDEAFGVSGTIALFRKQGFPSPMRASHLERWGETLAIHRLLQGSRCPTFAKKS